MEMNAKRSLISRCLLVAMIFLGSVFVWSNLTVPAGKATKKSIYTITKVVLGQEGYPVGLIATRDEKPFFIYIRSALPLNEYHKFEVGKSYDDIDQPPFVPISLDQLTSDEPTTTGAVISTPLGVRHDHL